MWLDAWVHGEEERASFLWRGLPNHVILHILKLRTIEEWTTKFDCVLKLRLKRRAINKWKWKTLLLRALRPARLAGLSRYEMFDAHAPQRTRTRTRQDLMGVRVA